MVSEQTKRPPARTFTEDEKAAFFSSFERLGSIRLAAEELGFKAMTCRRWVTQAGIDVKLAQRARRTEYFRLRADAIPRKEAARRVGLNIRTAVDWDQGIRHADNRRIRPDGRIIDYNKSVTALSDSHIRLTPAQLKPIASRYLSLVDREAIRDLTGTGMSIRSIAMTLRRAPSTISREIIRNSQDNLSYLPYAAQRAAAGRRPRPREAKLVKLGGLRDFIQEKLKIRWSPEQICHALVTQFPADKDMRVVPETIYQALYVQARGGLRREVHDALRTGRTRRKPRKTDAARRPRFRDPMVMIADRPPEIEDREVPGHWEGDLITGRLNKTAIGTLVERTTRNVMLVHLPGAHTADAVRDGLVAAIGTLPAHLRGSLTWDQGSEMSTHKSFTTATNMPVYFCDPASPWQRGSNENTNGLLRQYFPKGSDLSVYGLEDLERVAQELNDRPRKSLGWDTPAERFRDLLIST